MFTNSFIAQRLLRKRQASQLTPSRPVGPREVILPTSREVVAAIVLFKTEWSVVLAATEVALVLIACAVLGVATDEKETEDAAGELVKEATGEAVELIRGCCW